MDRECRICAGHFDVSVQCPRPSAVDLSNRTPEARYHLAAGEEAAAAREARQHLAQHWIVGLVERSSARRADHGEGVLRHFTHQNRRTFAMNHPQPSRIVEKGRH
jgi:hypothetical protein